VIGFFCVLADCVFVERRPSEINEAKAQMERRLDKDKVLCLFPEGTTSDGKTVLPFRSGFLSLAEEYEMPVQPASIAYTHIGDEPVVDARREEIAWVGDSTFFGHAAQFLGLPPLRAEVVLHPAMEFGQFEDRKELTKAAEETIRQSLAGIWKRYAS
jgi:1-acyl-sn-glycerol-3-phosphate acyltransferase